MKRRAFLTGLFSMPAIAVASIVTPRDADTTKTKNEEEVFISVNYGGYNFDHVDHGTYFDEFLLPLTKAIVAKAEEKGYIIGTKSNPVSTGAALNLIQNLGNKIFDSEKINNLITYTSTERSSSVFTVALTKAPVATKYRVING